MTCVLDSSVALTWYFTDEQTKATVALLERVADEGAVVPALWRLEIANGLQMALRRKRIGATYRDLSLQELELLPIAVDEETHSRAWTATLALSDRYGLTVYDAAYLELAQRRMLALASLDRELRAAAKQSDVRLLGMDEDS